MERSLIWVAGDAQGWACSNCRWKFPVPTLLTEKRLKGAYDRLGRGEDFANTSARREAVFCRNKSHNWTLPPLSPVAQARALIKRGYTPKVAAELVLHEMEFDHGSDSRMMEKARAEAEDFLQKVREKV